MQTLDQEEKNIKIQEKIEENQIIEIQVESQNKPIKNKNMMNEIKQNFIQIKNDESTISTKKLTRQPKALHPQDKISEKTTEKKDSSKKETTTKKENKKSTTKTVSISKVKISRNMDLTKRTGLSRKDFIKLMSGVRADTSGFFEKNAGKIYDLCEKYSINEIFFCGLISAESGWNIASNHRRTHNYISLMKNGKLISYGSVNEGLEVAAQKLHYNYLTPGGKFYHGKTLSGVKTCFCPSSSWVGLVYGRMRQIL